MTIKDAIAKAAALFAEWQDGDVFERVGANGFNIITDPENVVTHIFLGDNVRIKARPKKVLRPAWEILRDAQAVGKVKLYGREVLIVVSNLGFEVALKYIVEAEGADRETVNSEWPDSWFTTEEANR